jgi:ADP-ribosylation factor 1/2
MFLIVLIKKTIRVFNKMGGLLSNLFNFNSHKRILLVGLDNSGKTSILYRMNMGEFVLTTPTIGFNVESFKYKKTTFSVWDVGGQDRLRKLWKHYFSGTDGLVFVIDVNDNERLKECMDEIKLLLSEDELSNTPFLILANKIDLGVKINYQHVFDDITNFVAITNLSNEFKIQPCCAKTGEGLYEGFAWIDNTLKINSKKTK